MADGPLGVRWGLRNGDVNFALGDLVELVGGKAKAYGSGDSSRAPPARLPGQAGWP